MTGTSYVGVQPHFTVRDGKAALDFYRAAFGAEELFRLTDPADGRLGHAEIRIGSSVLMLNDEYPDFGALSPDTLGGSPVQFTVEVSDARAAVERAVAAGATVLRPVARQFYGCDTGVVVDPFGHRWSLQSKAETVSPTEMQRRWDAETGA